MGKVKLTKPQMELLRFLATTNVDSITDNRTVHALQRYGYAERVRDERGIIHFSDAWQITDLGRSALANEGRGT